MLLMFFEKKHPKLLNGIEMHFCAFYALKKVGIYLNIKAIILPLSEFPQHNHSVRSYGITKMFSVIHYVK